MHQMHLTEFGVRGLLLKLSKCGVSGTLLKWFESYLSERKTTGGNKWKIFFMGKIFLRFSARIYSWFCIINNIESDMFLFADDASFLDFFKKKWTPLLGLTVICLKGVLAIVSMRQKSELHTHIIDPRSFRLVNMAIFTHTVIKKTYFLYVPIYFRFLFITSVILWVQTCFTYGIKGKILAHLNIIVSNFYSKRKIIIFWMKVKND